MISLNEIQENLQRDLDTDNSIKQGITRRHFSEYAALLFGASALGAAGAALAVPRLVFGQATGEVVGSIDELLEAQEPGKLVTERKLVPVVERYDTKARKKSYENGNSVPYMEDRQEKTLGGEEFHQIRETLKEILDNPLNEREFRSPEFLDLINDSYLILVKQVTEQGKKGTSFQFLYRENGGTYPIPNPEEVTKETGVKIFKYVSFDRSDKLHEAINGILPISKDDKVDDERVLRHINYAQKIYGSEDRVNFTFDSFEAMRRLLDSYDSPAFEWVGIVTEDIPEKESIRGLLALEGTDEIKGRNRKVLGEILTMYEDSMARFASVQEVMMGIEAEEEGFIGFTGPGDDDYADKFLHLNTRFGHLGSLVKEGEQRIFRGLFKDLYGEKEGYEIYKNVLKKIQEEGPVSVEVTGGKIDTAQRNKYWHKLPETNNLDLQLGAGMYQNVWNVPGMDKARLRNAYDSENRNDIKSVWLYPLVTTMQISIANPLRPSK